MTKIYKKLKSSYSLYSNIDYSKSNGKKSSVLAKLLKTQTEIISFHHTSSDYKLSMNFGVHNFPCIHKQTLSS